jgi:hypothetical protein
MKEKSSLELFAIALYEGGYLQGNGDDINDLLEQHKAMHKEEITKAMSVAFIDGAKIGGITYESPYEDWEQYYNETFGGNK